MPNIKFRTSTELFKQMMAARMESGLSEAETVEQALRDYLSEPARNLQDDARRIANTARDEKRLMTEEELADFEAAAAAVEALCEVSARLVPKWNSESKPLREKASAAIETARKIADRADNQKRLMSANEKAQFDASMNEADRLQREADRLEFLNPPASRFTPGSYLRLEMRASAGEANDLAGLITRETRLAELKDEMAFVAACAIRDLLMAESGYAENALLGRSI